MRAHLTSCTLALSLLSLCVLAPLARAETTALPPQVHEAVKDVMNTYDIAGLAIAISVNGKEQFHNFGVASRSTQAGVTPDTLFEVGSVSKVFTATLATYAQANGKLSLSETVSHYLPELKGSAFGKVVLTHLATHTAGGFPLQVPETVKNRRQLIEYLNDWTPLYPAGTQRSYANPSIGMLGLIAAKSLNMTYNQALEQHLFPALGLKNSYLRVPEEKMALYAQGYDKEGKPVRLNPGVLADEAYGVKTSARDLLHFTQLSMAPGTLPAPLRQALDDTRVGYFQVGPMTQDLIWEQYPTPVSLDSLLTGNSNKMAYSNNGAIALNPVKPPQPSAWVNKTGSTGGFGAYVAFVPGEQKSVVILANKNYPNEARIKLAYTLLNTLN